MQAVQLRGVTKTYDGHRAVEPLDLDVPSGKVYGLLGPNGAGKTTTIRMMMGIILPDEGSIELLGQPYAPSIRGRIGYLPEERGLYPKMKIGEQLDFFGGLQGIEKAERGRRITHWLDRLSLSDWSNRKVEELSKGMQQKLQFIATVLHDPELLILDEPFAGLDPVNTKLLKDIMLEFVKRGRTVILSTHRMEQVEMVCDNICLINKGQKVVDGSLADVKQRYGHDSVQIEYDGEIALETLTGVDAVDDYGQYAELRLKDGADPQDVLAALVGKVQIRRFELTQPSINDVFIELVGEPVQDQE